MCGSSGLPPKARDFANRRTYRNNETILSAADKETSRRKSAVRSKVGYPFLILERLRVSPSPVIVVWPRTPTGRLCPETGSNPAGGDQPRQVGKATHGRAASCMSEIKSLMYEAKSHLPLSRRQIIIYLSLVVSCYSEKFCC